MPTLLDALLDVFAQVRNLRLRHERGLATRQEAVAALSVLELLNEEDDDSQGTMRPLIGAVQEVLDTLPMAVIGVVWRPEGAWQPGEPDVVIVPPKEPVPKTLVAAAHVTASQLRRVAETHLDPYELVAFAECHHRHTDGLEHRHHEEAHDMLERAQDEVGRARGLRERTVAVETVAAADAAHQLIVDSLQ